MHAYHSSIAINYLTTHSSSEVFWFDESLDFLFDKLSIMNGLWRMRRVRLEINYQAKRLQFHKCGAITEHIVSIV